MRYKSLEKRLKRIEEQLKPKKICDCATGRGYDFDQLSCSDLDTIYTTFEKYGRDLPPCPHCGSRKRGLSGETPDQVLREMERVEALLEATVTD